MISLHLFAGSTVLRVLFANQMLQSRGVLDRSWRRHSFGPRKLIQLIANSFK